MFKGGPKFSAEKVDLPLPLLANLYITTDHMFTF